MKRAISLFLSLVLVLALLPPSTALADSQAYGQEVWLRSAAIGDGVVYSENIFWSDGYNKPRHEYYFTYSPAGGLPDLPPLTPTIPVGPDAPGESTPPADEDIPGWLLTNGTLSLSALSNSPGAGQVVPVAAYGSSVCARLTASEAARYYEGLGYRVVGAVNGDFYDTATGYPLGLLISAGQLLSGASSYYAVGFRQDGSAVIGEPQLEITASTDTQSVKLASLNKPRVDKAGITMLTYDYRTDHDTGPSVASDGVNVVAAIVGGRASIGESLTLRVEEVSEDANERVLRPDQVLLSGASNGYDVGLAFLRSLTPGQTLTVSFSTPDPAWNDVAEAIGALYLLVSDGQPITDFEAVAAPRTAVGVKANGDVVLYTIDGRQSSHSMGASLSVVARRMAELGCVTALALDGGGSTTALAALPDSASAKVLNSPSDKSERKVTNHILLLAPGQSTGVPGSIYLTANAPAVLAGHTVAFSAQLADTNFFPMSGSVSLEASGGDMVGNTLTAPPTGGVVTVTARSGGVSSQLDVLVLDEPETLSIQQDGAAAANLSVTPGQTVAFSAAATYRHRPLEISASDLVWTVEGDVGTVDENGLFTAALTPGTGTVTATRGSVSARVTVTVTAEDPFVDTQGHWASPYLTSLYYQGVLTGVEVNGQLFAYPDNGVTRAEFSVLLARYMGLNPEDYALAALPFTDLGSTEDWAGDAIRAMYVLGIVNGTDPTHFSPQSPLTRAQTVTMLGRMLGVQEENEGGVPELPDVPLFPLDPNAPGAPDAPAQDPLPPDAPDQPGEPVPSDTPAADLSQFADESAIPDYAYPHFQTLVGLGAVSGTAGRLDPEAAMTRAAVCKVLDTLP